MISNEQVEQFHEEGYFVMDPQWDHGRIQAVSDEFDRLYDRHIREIKSNPGGDQRQRDLARLRPFIGQAHRRSDVLCAFVKSPVYMEACLKFIGPDADLYYNQVVIKPAEHGWPFAWHQDSAYHPTQPLEYITCWTAITHTVVENGCIWVIPGSHKAGLIKHIRNERNTSTDAAIVNESAAIAVEMLPGQVAILSSLMLHRSGPNRSDQVRKGYVPQYHVPDVISQQTGKPWGDRYSVMRDGKPV